MRKKLIPLLFGALSHIPFFGAQREVKAAHEPPAIIDALALKISENLPPVARVVIRVVVPIIKNKFGHSRKLNKKILRYRAAV